MSLLSRCHLLLGFGLVLAILFLARADAEEPNQAPDKKNVTFRSVDGVELKGTYWSTGNPKKHACVLLLHNFSKQKGGDSHQDGWDSLAEDLAKDGDLVLSFDFRGHGDSKTIGKEFWNRQYTHNQALLRPPTTIQSTTIDYKNFPTTPPSYYSHLVDDVAAAKSFLDSKAGSAAGNLIIIGAGQGATIGAMWAAAELRLHRDKLESAQLALGFTQLNLDKEPEGKDLACCVWLTISGLVEGQRVPAASWLEEAGGKKHKVPMFFVYGKDDPAAKGNALASLAAIMPGFKEKDLLGSASGQNKVDMTLKHTRDWAVEGTKLTGSQLLDSSLSTSKTVQGYINAVMEDRGSRETERYKPLKYRYVWVNGNQITPAKVAGEEMMQPINPTMMRW